MTSHTNHQQPSGDAGIVRLLRDGDEHLRLGRGSEAEACFRGILAREPENPDALHRCGVIAFLRGRPGEAVDLLRRAAAQSDGDAGLWGHLASALMADGQLDEAIVSWQRAVVLAPDYDGAYAKLGDAYLAKGDIEASEAAYRKSIALAPDAPKAYAGL